MSFKNLNDSLKFGKHNTIKFTIRGHFGALFIKKRLSGDQIMIIRLMKLFALVLIVATFSACTGPERITQTASGWPEIEINPHDAEIFRSELVARCLSKGWLLEDESKSSLLFTKVDSSGSLKMAFTQSLIGNAYSTPPKYELRYTFANTGSITRVVSYYAVSSQMAMGKVNRMELRNNKDFNAIQQQLYELKALVEGQ